MSKKITMVVLALIMLLTLSACGGGGDVVPSINGDGKPFGKYEQPVTLSMVRASDATIESDVLSKYPSESIENNRFTQLFADKLNVKVEYKWIAANAEQYKSKLNLAMSIGDLPDTFMVNPSQVSDLVEAEQIKDLTEVWETYASPLLKEITTKEGDGVLKAVTIDGKLYGIPQMFSSTDRSQFVWIRMDWLRYLVSEYPNLNLTTTPKTVEDFLKISSAFKTYGKELSGKNTTGLAMQGNLWDSMGGITGLMNMYGSYPNIWLEKNGKLVNGSVQQETKAALEVLRGMYSRGEIPLDFATKTTTSIADDVGSSKAGMVFGEQWLCSYPLSNTYISDNSADWQGFPLFSNNGVETKSQVSMGTYGWFVVSNSNARPEAIIKLMNVYVDSIWGENADFEKYYMPSDTSAAVWKLSPVNPEPPTKNLDAYLAIKKAKAENNFGSLTGEAKSIYNNIQAFHNDGAKNMWSWSIGYEPNDKQPAVFEAMNTYITNGRIMYDLFTGAPTPTMVESLALMNQKQNEMFTNIINGSKSLDEFDKFVTSWNELGGSAITREVNEWYALSK